MGLRFARVEQVLGLTGSIEDADDSTLLRGLELLMERSVVEADDLDFKAAWWSVERSKHPAQDGRHELAKDCVAMANAGGGVLIVGVGEDGAARAVALMPLDGEPGEEQLIQILTDRVTPALVGVRVRTVRSSGDSHGVAGYFALVLVPPSSLAPHCVRRPNEPGLLYPVRRGRTTAYLSETEVATRYRDRFQLARTQVERVRDVLEQGESKLDRTPGRLWVSVAVLPADAVAERMSGRLVERITATDASLESTTLRRFLVPFGHRRYPAAQLGRVVVTDHPERERSRAERLEVHLRDGAVFTAMAVVGDAVDDRVLVVDQVMVEMTVLTVLERAIAHVPRGGGAGDALIAARLLLSELPAERPDPTNPYRVAAPRSPAFGNYWMPVRVGWTHEWRVGQSANELLAAARSDDTPPIEIETPLDPASDHAGGLVSAAAGLASELLTADRVHDLAFLYHDGRVAAVGFALPGRDPRQVQQQLTTWATSRGIGTSARPAAFAED